jgi:hypothetical protein
VSSPQRAEAETWARRVASEVQRQLQARGEELEHGDPRDVASRMVASVPRRSAWNVLGPFYTTTGIARILGGVSRQAVDDRRRRGRIIALQTEEGTWLYPAFQLDERGRLLTAVVDAHRNLAVGRIDAWSAASALLGPQPELGGRSMRDHLAAGLPPAPVEDLVRTAVANLA